MTIPEITYDDVNDRAYIVFSSNKVVKSRESEDGFLVFDVDKDDKLVAVEITSVLELIKKAGFGTPKKQMQPSDIPTYLIPEMYNCYKTV